MLSTTTLYCLSSINCLNLGLILTFNMGGVLELRLWLKTKRFILPFNNSILRQKTIRIYFLFGSLVWGFTNHDWMGIRLLAGDIVGQVLKLSFWKELYKSMRNLFVIDLIMLSFPYKDLLFMEFFLISDILGASMFRVEQ